MTVPRRATLALVAAAFLLGACSGGDAPTPGPTRAPTSTPSTTPAPQPPPPEKACYRLRAKQITTAHIETPPVKCRREHTSQTYLVIKLRRKTIGDPEAIDTKAIAEAADRRCRGSLRRHLGGDREKVALSRFTAAWFVPTEQDFARGARWLRCDLVAYKTEKKLATLPRRSTDLLSSSSALDQWGTCAKASARRLGNGKGLRVCAIEHNWRAVSTHRLAKKSAPWPGAKQVRGKVLDRCEEDVRSFTDNKTEAASVGWLPPTREQWKSGRRYGTCWAKIR